VCTYSDLLCALRHLVFEIWASLGKVEGLVVESDPLRCGSEVDGREMLLGF
jgi:hypothetical protein